MELIYLLAGLILGFVVAFVWLKSQQGKSVDAVIQRHPTVLELRRSLDRTLAELRNERVQKEEGIAQLATSQQRALALDDRLANQAKELQALQDQLKLEFQNLANRIFEEKSTRFTQQNKEQIDTVLSPFRDKLKDFETKVDKVYSEENKERINLKAEIKMLTDLNGKLSAEAHHLATALKGDNKAQGNWGELVLEKILERSGLQEGIEFKTQHTTENREGDRIRPDVVIFLPEGKHLIIDAKISLLAYNASMESEEDEQRERFKKAHIESVRSHIKLLGDKNYHTGVGLVSPDFVLMFMPIEAAFSMAIQYDPEIYSFAWDRKIVLVSPTTLLATLRTISSIWKQEKRTRNAELIAEEGGKLYDKFAAFVKDLVDLGIKMDQAKSSYSEAMKKLSEGSGNLVNRAEKMRKLGAKSSKEIHSKVVERSVDSALGIGVTNGEESE